jgi:hypothetical protein
MKTSTRFFLSLGIGLWFNTVFVIAGYSQTLTCTFSMLETACLEQHVKITYTGNATSGDSCFWNFDGGVVLEGSGLGPYWIKWLTTGEKHVTLYIHENGMTCDHSRTIVIVELPALFHMTGGGSYPQGGIGVPVGLNGSQPGVIYKLRRGYEYTGIAKTGTGNPIDFGLQTTPGVYDCVAKIDGSDCLREMEGEVTVSVLTVIQPICMVTYDTLTNHNTIIWNKIEPGAVLQFNVYRETHMNNHYEKIGEVPYTNLSIFTDTTSNPLVKSDKYKLSVTDTAGNEYEKSPHHKTIHLNISPGIFGFNLIWNHYEGFEFLTYKIYRKLGTGAFILIDSVASNVDSYTDTYITSGIATYFIGVVRMEPCEPSLKSNDYLMTRSNVVFSAPLGVSGEGETGILIYPNPVRDQLIVSIPGNGDGSWVLEIFRPDGRKMFETVGGYGMMVVDVSQYKPGLYILKLRGESVSTIRKFVKE